MGRIGGESLIRGIAGYLRAVEAFKDSATGHTPTPIIERNPGLCFAPEFEGSRKKYRLTAAIESQCDHGTVVNILRTELRASGLTAYNTRMVDLFLADDKANITHLIEVKTDQTTTSLYRAVGQVMLHGALQKNDPKRVLVLPGEVSADTASRMTRLGIQIIRYEWQGNTPVVENLKKAVS